MFSILSAFLNGLNNLMRPLIIIFRDKFPPSTKAESNNTILLYRLLEGTRNIFQSFVTVDIRTYVLSFFNVLQKGGE